MVKNLPAVRETRVQFLGWEDHLEKGTPTHSSILAWRILWTEEPGGLQSMRLQESDMTERLSTHHSIAKHRVGLKKMNNEQLLRIFLDVSRVASLTGKD